MGPTTEEVESRTGEQALDCSMEYHIQAKRGLHQKHMDDCPWDGMCLVRGPHRT